jgi:hypothetical protein
MDSSPAKEAASHSLFKKRMLTSGGSLLADVPGGIARPVVSRQLQGEADGATPVGFFSGTRGDA